MFTRLRHLPRTDISDGFRQFLYMFGARAEAASGYVQQAFASHKRKVLRKGLRTHRVRAAFVRDAGIRMTAHAAGGEAGDFFHQREHFGGAERAVYAEGEGIRVLDGGVERFERLPGEGAAAAVADSSRNYQRKTSGDIFESSYGRFRVQCVEAGFDKYEIYSPVYGARICAAKASRI